MHRKPRLSIDFAPFCSFNLHDVPFVKDESNLTKANPAERVGNVLPDFVLKGMRWRFDRLLPEL
jgi:hypothetical protein